jgi:pantoate--beta-alanine ligase
VQTVNRLTDLRKAVDSLRASKRAQIALVPTMGALHEGHLSLVRLAKQSAGMSVVVSIFVNPAQFGPNEDLGAYPRQLAEDSRLLEAEGVDVLWAPPVEEVYPDGFVTTVKVGVLAERLCGAARPGHFDGVATVVAKLFAQVRPDAAVFGEKDWQQLALIRRMARDLDLTQPHVDRIVGLPIVREPDGLAMSSRNRYLSPEDRAHAAALPRLMFEAVRQLEIRKDTAQVLSELEQGLLTAGFSSVDYVELADEATLQPREPRSGAPVRLFIAARIGGTRLIDNHGVGPL